MRVMFLGDIHGHQNRWKKFIHEYFDKVDLVVFTGDYVDDYVLPNHIIIENLEEIIQFKKDFPDKVILLLGNHDNQYLYINDRNYLCSGYRPEIEYDIHDILYSNKNLLQNAWQYNNVIATHAGIQDNWFKQVFSGNELLNIADQLNNPENRGQLYALSQVGWMRGGFRGDIGGIFWCDRDELKKPLKNYIQVVGHTPVKEIKHYKAYEGEVYFIDCMDKINKPLILEI